MTNVVLHLLLASTTAATSPLPAAPLQPAGQVNSERRSSSLPADFTAPTLAETARFKLVPLGPALVDIDFKAYMSSIDHLQKTFTRGTSWPHKDISHADAERDMETEKARFANRQSFAYAVLTPDGLRERGSVYVSPNVTGKYDAVVRMWVTKAEYDSGFDAELYMWVSHWVKTDWPFANVAYPGRSIDWPTWDAIVAANKPKTAIKEKKP